MMLRGGPGTAARVSVLFAVAAAMLVAGCGAPLASGDSPSPTQSAQAQCEPELDSVLQIAANREAVRPDDDFFAVTPGVDLEWPDVSDEFSDETRELLGEEALAWIALEGLVSEEFDQIQTLPGFMEGGLVDGEPAEMWILWHGDLTSEAHQLIQSFNDRGLPVRVEYSEVDQLSFFDGAGHIASSLGDQGVGVMQVAPEYDGSFEVGVMPETWCALFDIDLEQLNAEVGGGGMTFWVMDGEPWTPGVD